MDCDISFAQRLLEIRILSENLCCGKNKQGIDINQKIMFVIFVYKTASPSVIIGKLGIKKSNLAIACRDLQSNNKIEKFHSMIDKRQVFYKLTPLGEQEVKDFLTNISEVFREEEIGKKEMNHFSKVCEILNKKI